MEQMTRAAVLVVDMQPEFLTPGTALKRPVSAGGLMEPLTTLVDAARQAGHVVVWVSSERPDSRRPADEPGRAGEPLIDQVRALQRPEDVQVSKADGGDSAFGRTELQALLRERGVAQVVVCGVMTHLGVRATAMDAASMGFEALVASDASASARASDHRAALAALTRHQVGVEPTCVILTRWRAVRRGLGAGDTEVHYGVLPAELDAVAFERALAELPWQQMHHRGGLVPRLVCLQGQVREDGTWPLYRHPADEQPTLAPWAPLTLSLVQIVEQVTGLRVNHALIQRYVDGAGYISTHADKTLDIARGTPILGLSLGATRSIVLRPKPGASGEPQVLELPHGSIFVLGWQTNLRYQHGIHPDRRQEGERRADERRAGGQRISLTMRAVATFMRPDGIVFGQGARQKQEPPGPLQGPLQGLKPPQQLEQAERMLTAFGLENQRADFDWDAHYGEGFDVVDLAALRQAQEPRS